MRSQNRPALAYNGKPPNPFSKQQKKEIFASNKITLVWSRLLAPFPWPKISRAKYCYYWGNAYGEKCRAKTMSVTVVYCVCLDLGLGVVQVEIVFGIITGQNFTVRFCGLHATRWGSAGRCKTDCDCSKFGDVINIPLTFGYVLGKIIICWTLLAWNLEINES